MKKYILAALVLLLTLAGCAAQAPRITPEQVIERFTAAGLAVSNITTTDNLVVEVQNAAPSCVAHRFDVEGDDGARVVVCGEERHAEAVERYYVQIGEASPLLFSHVERRGPLVFQMSGSLPAETFQSYVAQLP